jgi:DNA-binding CsgD family transcriptional regulator
MSDPVNVLILGASPIYCYFLKQMLDFASAGYRAHVLGAGSRVERGPVADPEVLVLAPHTWEEMGSWVPFAQRHFAARPWLLFADLRLIGMFMSSLERQRCAPVALDAPPEEFGRVLEALARGHGAPLAAELLTRFARGAATDTAARRTRFPTPMELQCGCAVSLGLGNRQISERLIVGEATVKTHIHHLLHKLGLANRTELGAYVQRALAPSSPPFRWK